MIMCMLCVVHRLSRRVATMLPWLVIPLLLIWALSLLLPPSFRFEITSPRLACVVVLLITLFWYEILMPMLSTWRARRSARIREERRTQAIELQKLKRLATRRCRNCFTPYRDQNPGGGKFMCSYCGHISKRPVLDLPRWQDWSGESVSVPPRFWVNGSRGGDERCLTENSYSGVLVFGCRLVGSFFLKVRWVWRKVFRVGSGEDDLMNGESKGLSNKRGENGGQESRGERARRKAEEKRLARLERELLEEEERKQREEVAKLVEERRKLRDEKLEAERSQSKPSCFDGGRDSRKETDRRRREKRREKDKGSSKSNSDGEELEKRESREHEKKREDDKKNQTERPKATVEGNGSKVVGNKTRYFDRMKGTRLSSSRGFNGSSFFGRNAQPAVTLTRVSKPAAGFTDNGQNSGIKRDTHSSGSAVGKSTTNGDQQPVAMNVQPRATVLKKSWHQLFTRSSAVSPDPDTNNSTFGNLNCQVEASSVIDQKAFPSYSVDNQFTFRRSLPVTGYSSPNSSNGTLASNLTADSMFFPIKEPMHNGAVEDTELFEDPCYVPDPFFLLGPGSDQLDKLPLGLENGFIEKGKVEAPCILKNVSASVEVSKPSPIEAPLSRSREEKHASCTSKSQKLHSSKSDESNDMRGIGTWQMWGTPLAQDGPSRWFLPVVQSKSNQENVSRTLDHNPIIPQVATGIPLLSVLTPQKASIGTFQNGGVFGPVGPGLNGNDPWVQNSPFPSQLPVDGESHFLPLDLIDNIAQNEVTFSTSTSTAAVHPFEVPRANGWSMAANGIKNMANSTPPVKHPNVGGLFSTGPDVQSVWSFNHQ